MTSFYVALLTRLLDNAFFWMGLRIVQYWILLSASLGFAGWFLSVLHFLTPLGYLFCLGALAIGFGVVKPSLGWKPVNPSVEFKKLRHRFSRPLPLLFLMLAALSLLGGLLYAPSQGDSHSYRIPRVYHWLWENQWHWIHTGDVRMNVIVPGIEWYWAPGMAVLPGDRWLFIVNWISYLLFPGLLFSLLRETGVRRRVAWWWMWLFWAAYGYALPAGGISTDSYGAVFSMAALVFALKARRSGQVSDLWISLLAAALLTSVKQTNILLLPIWLLPFATRLKLLLRRPLLTVLVILVGLGASFIPISILNQKYMGTWQGFKGADAARITPQSPLWGVLGNAVMIPVQNLMPPLFPQATQWNAWMDQLSASSFGREKLVGFERFGYLYRGPSEETGGLGLHVSLLVIVALAMGRTRLYQRTHSELKSNRVLRWTFFWLPPLLLIVFMAKVGVYTNARYLAPMYPLLLVPLLLRSPDLSRNRVWRGAVYLSMFITALGLIISRQRPLFPVQTIISLGQRFAPNSQGLGKAQRAYDFANALERLRENIRGALPADARVVGYMTDVGLMEGALWKPFGSRRVHRFASQDSPAYVRSKGTQYVLLEEPSLRKSGLETIENWLQTFEAEVIRTFPMKRVHPENSPETLFLVKLK